MSIVNTSSLSKAIIRLRTIYFWLTIREYGLKLFKNTIKKGSRGLSKKGDQFRILEKPLVPRL